MTKEESEKYQLNAARFPKRLDLELSEDVIAMIKRRAEQTGRSFSEVVTDIISRNMND